MAKALSPKHKKWLMEDSGFSEETIREIGWYSVTKSEAAKLLHSRKVPSGGIAIPYPGVEGYCRVRFDNPGEEPKYKGPWRKGNYLYIPPAVKPYLDNPTVALYITEGEKKAVKATQEGFPTLGLSGTWGWRTAADRDKPIDLSGYKQPPKKAKTVVLPEIKKIVWAGRNVFVVFDSDAADNYNARSAGEHLAAALRQLKAQARFVFLPAGSSQDKVGLDDFLIAHGKEQFKRFVEQKLHESVHEDRNFDIQAIEKLDTDPPIYRVTVFGKTIRMDGATLANFSQFAIKVMETTDRIPDIFKPSENWRRYLDDALTTKLEVIEAPQEANREEIWWWHILKYLEQRSVEEESALAEDRGVFKNGEYIYFHGPTLHKYLTSRQIKVEPRELWDLLRGKGAETRNKWVVATDGNKVRVRAWRVPYSDLEEAEPPAKTEQKPVDPGQEEFLDHDYEPW